MRLTLAAAVLLPAPACRTQPVPEPAPDTRPVAIPSTSEDLPPPSWRVVARREGQVLLAAERVLMRGVPRRDDDRRRAATVGPAREYPTLIFENGRLRDGPVARADFRALAGRAGQDTLRLYSLRFRGRPVFFAQTGEGPTPHESPTESGLYVVEHGDRLWLLADSGVTRLTADTVRGVARDTLRSQTREGGPYLFWATHPVWSPDGSTVAYVTNRTWMLARPSGQEVWLAEVRARRERPVLSERGEFFSPEGWLGAELVYKAREGGIIAVDVETGRRRTIAAAPPRAARSLGGVAVAFSTRRPRLLYMTSVGDAVRAHVLTERGTVDVPSPPAGERLDYAGRFSPSGDRLVLGTSFARDSGITRALYVFDLGARRLTRLAQWSFREGSRHPLGLPAWLDDLTLLLTRFDRGTGLESSALVRLPRPR